MIINKMTGDACCILQQASLPNLLTDRRLGAALIGVYCYFDIVL